MIPLYYAYCLIFIANSVIADPPQINYFQQTLSRFISTVVSGSEATRHQFPYQISLQHNRKHICGGALISETRVVTAAHCKIGRKGRYEVVAGMLQINEKHKDIQKIKVKSFTVHPRFPRSSKTVSSNDIAFIILSKPVKLSKAVQFIELPTEDQCNLVNEVTITGWGLTDFEKEVIPKTLQWAKLKQITNNQCRKNLISVGAITSPLDSTMMCIVSELNSNESACKGDSGGPLVFDNVVAGVISWGVTPCGIPNAPSVATRICNHSRFITSAPRSGAFLHEIKFSSVLSICIVVVYLINPQC